MPTVTVDYCGVSGTGRIGTVARTFATTRPSIAAALTDAVITIRNHIN